METDNRHGVEGKQETVQFVLVEAEPLTKR